MRRLFLDNLELWLSAAGIFVILAAPQVVHARGDAAFHVAAWVATAVGVLHGVIFWLVRRRQRELRREVIEELRGMLRDRVHNNLTVISMGLSEVEHAEGKEKLEDLQQAVDRISTLVTSLSDESVRSWKDHYATSLARGLR